MIDKALYRKKQRFCNTNPRKSKMFLIHWCYQTCYS